MIEEVSYIWKGLPLEPLGIASNYYYTELSVEWPKLYNLIAEQHSENGITYYTGAFYEDVLQDPSDIDYFLDFIIHKALISRFSIDNIGRKYEIKSNDDFNCVFEPDIPNFVIIEAGKDETDVKREKCEKRAQHYIQVNSNIFDSLAFGGNFNSWYWEIKIYYIIKFDIIKIFKFKRYQFIILN